MRRLAVAVCALLAVTATPAVARPLPDAVAACTVTYTGAADDSQWTTPGNWSTGRVPAATDDVCVPDGFPIVFVSGAAAARTLDAGAASLFVTDGLAVGTGGATVDGLDIRAGASVSTAGPLAAGSVNLHGGALDGPGALTAAVLRWSAGTLGGAATVNGNAFLAGDLGGAGAGLRIAPGATAQVRSDTTLAVPLANDGQLSVDAGVLTLTGGGTGSGSYQLAAGATLAWHAGVYSLASPAVTGPGRATVSGADVTTAGAASFGDLALTGGTLRVSGSLTASGYTQTAEGTLARSLDAPPLTVAGAATLAGTLAIDRGTLAPADGASFPVLSYGSVTGRWATLTIAPLGGVTFAVDYAAQGAAVVARRAPIPQPTVSPTPTPAPTATPAPAPPAPVLPEPAPPQPGVRTLADPDRGEVLVQLPPQTPGAPAGFVPLRDAASLPNGTIVDARKGQLTLVTASSFKNPRSAQTTVKVAAGIFRIRQVRAADGRTAVTDLIVRTPPGLARACVPPHKGILRPRTLQRTRPRLSHRTIRRIRATVLKGVVRTFGRVAVLTTRKASFELRDRCDGTSTRLSRGRGTLFDRVRGRTTRLRAHQSRLVRARLFTARRLHLKKVPRPRV